MRKRNLFSVLFVGALMVSLVACESKEQSFPDFDGGTTAYFAYQYPIRTLILGNVETYDNTSDNEGRFTIYGTFGGSYSGCNAKIDVSIDESLTQGLTFEDGTLVKAMPADYYTVSGNQLDYAGGYRGGIEIQLNDKFFDDTLSVKNTYVIPVVMGDFTGVDKINRGTPVVDGSSPLRQDASKWDPQPKDFTLFCVNYINKYTATYLRRGVDDYDALQYEDKEVGKSYFVVAHSADKKADAWDSQFWINVDHVFAAGEEYTLTMKIKATTECSSSSQIHVAPSEYKANLGTINFGTDWTTYTTSGTFDASQAGGHSIALNLNDLETANDYYFDDVSFIIDGVEYITNVECNEVDCDNFYTKEDQGEIKKSAYGNEPIIDRVYLGYSKEKGVRHPAFVEESEVVYTTSKSKNQIVMPLSTVEVANAPYACEMLLTFDENGNCTISSNTPGVKMEGTGKYYENSEKLAWGNKDRDGLYLNYTVELYDPDYDYTIHYTTSDTLVWRDRGTAASIQTYSPSFNE